jgi:hypothetical protein
MNTQSRLYTPWKLTAEQVNQEFESCSFRFIRPKDSANPEYMGSDIANELAATMAAVTSLAKEIIRPQDRIHSLCTKLCAGQSPSRQLESLQKILSRIKQNLRLHTIRRILDQISETGINTKLISTNDRSTREGLQQQRVTDAANMLLRVYSYECRALEEILQLKGVDKLPSFTVVAKEPSQNIEELRFETAFACSALKQVRKNKDWIMQPDSFVYRTDEIRAKISREGTTNSIPTYAEQLEYRQWLQINPDHMPTAFLSLFIFKLLNKLETSIAEEVWQKIRHLGLDQQKLWHTYATLSGRNEAVFVEKVRCLSQDLMAVADKDLWYLKEVNGFVLKQEQPLHYYEWKACKMIQLIRDNMGIDDNNVVNELHAEV